MDSDDDGMFLLDGEAVDPEEQSLLLAMLTGQSQRPAGSGAAQPQAGPSVAWEALHGGAGHAASVMEPFPDIHDLFRHYNSTYFGGAINFCSVQWSSGRMTLCGGVCEYQPGGGCRIKLSEPLLKLRPVRDLKDVLLHEMIHAYLSLEGIRDRGDHGPKFQEIMKAINDSSTPDHYRPPGGYHITVYHTMHAEVEHYRTHWWQCQRCSNIVKRAMNRPPQEADCRGRSGKGAACADPKCAWHAHLRTCGGTYDKIKSPEPTAQTQAGSKRKQPGTRATAAASKKEKQAAAAAEGARPITSFFPRVEKAAATGAAAQQEEASAAATVGSSSAPGLRSQSEGAVGQLGYRLGGAEEGRGPASGDRSNGAGPLSSSRVSRGALEAGVVPEAELRRRCADAAVARMLGSGAGASDAGEGGGEGGRGRGQGEGAAAARAAATVSGRQGTELRAGAGPQPEVVCLDEEGEEGGQDEGDKEEGAALSRVHHLPPPPSQGRLPPEGSSKAGGGEQGSDAASGDARQRRRQHPAAAARPPVICLDVDD